MLGDSEMVDDSMPTWNSPPEARKESLLSMKMEKKEWEIDEHERLIGGRSQPMEDLVRDNGIKHNLMISKLSQKQQSVGPTITTVQRKRCVYL